MSKPTTSFWVTPMCLYRSGWGAAATAQASPLDATGFVYIATPTHRIYVPQSPCVNPMDELLSASNGQRAGAVAPSTKAIGSLLQGGGGAIRPFAPPPAPPLAWRKFARG
jgi:hypothetical protein